MESMVEDQVVPENSDSIPEGFVYLHDIDPSIKHRLVLYSDYNFMGRPADGYAGDVVILTMVAALNLSKAQSIFNQDGYKLVVLDAYRPVRACQDFVRWGKDAQDQKMKLYFYPNINKIDAFQDGGYIAEKSSHSRGSTVDVTLIKYHNNLINPPVLITKKLGNNETITYYEDGTIDMGSPFDRFDEVSHTNCTYISEEAQKNRKYLVDVMRKCGFVNNAVGWGNDPKEWWHFTMENEPFPDKYFDFLVK